MKDQEVPLGAEPVQCKPDGLNFGFLEGQKEDNSSFIYEQALHKILEIATVAIKQVGKTEEPCKHEELNSIGICLSCNITIERRKLKAISVAQDYPNQGGMYKVFKLEPKGKMYPERRLSLKRS